MKLRGPTLVVLIGAAFGLIFAAVSTYDFVAHLDRQVHGIHCSFLPGLDNPDVSGESGCHTTLMSPYSSVFRQSIWGGLPVALPGLALFAFLLFWALNLWLGRRQEDPKATGLLLVAATVPLLTSLVMGYLAFVELDAACKLCIGIYFASAVCFGGALALFLQARNAPAHGHAAHATGTGPSGTQVSAPAGPPPGRPAPMHTQALLIAAAIGIVFVLLPVITYALAAPDYSKYIGACGDLPRPGDPQKVLLPLGQQAVGTEAIEVLDPLCPACKGFEHRLETSGLGQQLRRKALLFPLDTECNWMISESIHPGACAVSEAVLCAEGQAENVLDWAFEHQQEILDASKLNPKAAEQMVSKQFPGLAGCVGKAAVRAKLNRALRWAVANEMPVVTPQLYFGTRKVCDEDTDLGLDYTLSRMLGAR